MIKTIFFDAAGTLIQVRDPVGVTYARIAAKHGITLDAEAAHAAFIHEFKTRPEPGSANNSEPRNIEPQHYDWWQALYTAVVKHSCTSSIDTTTLASAFQETWQYYETPEAWALLPDAFELLNTLQGNYQMGILSNFDRRLLRVLKSLKIEHFFETIIISSDYAFSKPNPRLFEIALHSLNASPRTTLHVGDDPKKDWEGAQNAGLSIYKIEPPSGNLKGLLTFLKKT